MRRFGGLPDAGTPPPGRGRQQDAEHEVGPDTP
jgi:hypothetical protein